jgi:polyisoprenoid-binding protein YceI
MKSKLVIQLAFSLSVLFIAASVRAQDNFSMKSGNANIEGTSSLHDWKSEITDIQCTGLFEIHDEVLKSIKSAEIKILVEGIKSTKGKVMNNKTYEAFKYKKNPYIIYTFISGQIKTDNQKNSTIEATGNLSMAGEIRKISFITKVNVLPNGDLQVSASEKIKMTEYKMKPPTAIFGTIVVGDEITVNFNLVLTPIAAHAKSK